MARFLIWIILAYLMGSIPFGKLIANHRGVNIQKAGSGNIGFANVRRTLGWIAGVEVLIADLLKGFIPVFLAPDWLSTSQLSAVALATVLGHVFPIWLRFRGGKGVATGIGAALALNVFIGLIGIGVYLLVAGLFKKSWPSSLIAISVMAAAALFFSRYKWFYEPLLLLVLWAHRKNIQSAMK